LIVVIHGWWSNPSKLANLKKLLELKFPECEVDITFDYSKRAGLFSHYKPDIIARDLANHIHQLAQNHWQKIPKEFRPDHDLILVGHSIGALLIRSAFLLTAPDYLSDAPTSTQPPHWTKRIDRMVFLAAPNAGWELTLRIILGRITQGGGPFWNRVLRPLLFFWPLKFLLYNLGLRRVFKWGNFILSFYRGDEFITNLRIDAALATKNAARTDPNVKMPYTIFMRGAGDGYVNEEDYIDYAATSPTLCRYCELEDTGHYSIIEVASSSPDLVLETPDAIRDGSLRVYHRNLAGSGTEEKAV